MSAVIIRFSRRYLCVSVVFCCVSLVAQEPIQGEILRDLAPSSEESSSGPIQMYQILRLQLESPQFYQAIEFALEARDTQEPVSLVVYGQVGAGDRGTRLLTRGVAQKLLFQFHLAGISEHLSSSADSMSIPARNFPIYIVLYPFQDSQADPSYQYSVRFIKKDFGYVRFRLLLPPNSLDSSGLELKIDEENYNWALDPDYDSANSARFSRVYQVGLGQHSVQLSGEGFYARAQFQLEAGETKLVTLQLQERLSQLVLLVPQEARLLLDGIPLNPKRGAPFWQEVQVQELESYHYELARLQYRLTVAAGKHHLLIQYEGNTWQREVYLQEGSEHYFQLSWELRACEPSAGNVDTGVLPRSLGCLDF